MYELPEWEYEKEYFTILLTIYLEWKVEPFIPGWLHDFESLCYAGLVFSTRELAQIEAERRNAENKLRNLAREREKEFPIDWNNRKQEKIKPRFSFRLDDGRVSIDTDIDTDYIDANAIYFCGFTIYNEFGMLTYNFERWLRSVMSEPEIQALCQPRRYI